MKTFTILVTLLLSVSSIHASEFDFAFDTPVTYSLTYDQSVSGSIGNENVSDSWRYELDFELVMKRTFDQKICADVTLKRFLFTLKNAKGIRATYDSSTATSTPADLIDFLDSTLFLNFPSRYELSRNGMTAEKSNHHFQQYLKDLSDKSSVALIKEVMHATGNFWFLNEKNNMVSILNSLLTPPSMNKGGQIVTLQAMPLFATFPLNKWSFLSSFEKALCLKAPSCLLFISESTPTEIVGSWDEGFSSTLRDPTGPSIKENGTCKGTVRWNRTNFLLQERTWSWDTEVSDSQASLKFSIKHTIKHN